jgi:DNA polymerase III subunit delta
MKLNYSQLEMHLAKQLLPIYIISGEEILLKSDCSHWIRKAAKQAGFQMHMRLSETTHEGEIYEVLYTTSFLAEKKLLELDCRTQHPSKVVAHILEEYAKNPNLNNILLIDIGKIDSKLAKQAWYQACEKNGCVATVWPIPREQLPQWIMTRAKKYKLPFSSAAAQYLTDYVEGNLIAASQAIEKIYLFKPQDVIDETLINSILNDESSYTIFDLSENLIAGDSKRSLHILDKLKMDGIEPTLILWSITRELRLLAELSDQLRQGRSYDVLFQQYKIFFRRQNAIRKFLTQYSSEDCYYFLMQAARIDKLIKGVLTWNVWEALQLFCLRF